MIFFGDEFVPCNTAITFCFDYILITIHLFTFLFFNLSLDKHKNVFSSLQRWTDNIHCNSVEFCPCPCQCMHTRQSKKKTYMELRGRNPNVLTDVQEVFSESQYCQTHFYPNVNVSLVNTEISMKMSCTQPVTPNMNNHYLNH